MQGSLEEWLRLLRLEEYGPCLVSQGYSSVSEAATISIEDLEDTGFYRLGHQKRLTLAIRRLKELGRGGGGARPPHPPDYYSRYVAQSQEIHVQVPETRHYTRATRDARAGGAPGGEAGQLLLVLLAVPGAEAGGRAAAVRAGLLRATTSLATHQVRLSGQRSHCDSVAWQPGSNLPDCY